MSIQICCDGMLGLNLIKVVEMNKAGLPFIKGNSSYWISHCPYCGLEIKIQDKLITEIAYGKACNEH